jgi:hypothetical protein
VTTNIIHSIQIGPTVVFTDSLPKTREILIHNDSYGSYPKQHTAPLFCRDEDLLGPSKTMEQKHRRSTGAKEQKEDTPQNYDARQTCVAERQAR